MTVVARQRVQEKAVASSCSSPSTPTPTHHHERRPLSPRSFLLLSNPQWGSAPGLGKTDIRDPGPHEASGLMYEMGRALSFSVFSFSISEMRGVETVSQGFPCLDGLSLSLPEVLWVTRNAILNTKSQSPTSGHTQPVCDH